MSRTVEEAGGAVYAVRFPSLGLVTKNIDGILMSGREAMTFRGWIHAGSKRSSRAFLAACLLASPLTACLEQDVAEANGSPLPQPAVTRGDVDHARPLYGGPYAPWNVPAAGLPTDPASPLLVDKLWDHTNGRFNLNSDEWSVAVYDVAEATDSVAVDTRHPDWGNLHGKTTPWNPSWRIPDDSDAMVAVVDFETGHSWEFWGDTEFSDGRILAGSANLIQAGIKAGWGEPANIFTKENGYRVVRESGFPSAVLLATREEIEQGYIPHALTLLWPNPAKQVYVGPAIKGGGSVGGTLDRLPMGTRFVWDIPDEEIDAWAATLDPKVRKGMRAIAVALRDYGGIGSDHAGDASIKRGAIWIEHDYSADWDEIGFTREATFQMLDPLLSQNKHRVRAIAPCSWPNGDENKVCCYPGSSVTYPNGHDCHS